MRKRYSLLDPEEDEFELGDEDFQYIWDNFLDVRRFYRQAAGAGHAMIFTADC